jgi:hypothetical protein
MSPFVPLCQFGHAKSRGMTEVLAAPNGLARPKGLDIGF